MTIFLRSETQVEMREALLAANILWLGEGGEFLVNPECHFDEIGEIYKETGEVQLVDVGGDPMEFPLMRALPGWHVNILAELTEAQEILLPILDPPPQTPERVFQ